MNYAPRYLGRGSWLARRDPRVLVLAIACFVFSIIQVWDGRLVAILFRIALLYYHSAGIPFREVRRNWAFVIVFVSILVLVNTLITGGEVPGIPTEDLDVFATIPILGTPVSAQSIAYAGTQLLRFLAMAAVGFPLAFAMAPADFGVTFRRLGVPDKFAYGIDLTFRFLPSFGHDMQTTIDAQRVRGLDWEDGKAGRSAACGGPSRSSCRRSSMPSPARRTRSTRWTCAASGPGRGRGSATWRSTGWTGSWCWRSSCCS